MDPYDNVVGGRLKLRKKVKKVCKSELQNDSGTTLQRTTGSGRIVSSGNTVQGFETKFMDEAQSGDFIIIRHPQTHVEEEQKIIYIMSQRSLNIANPFSSDLITTTNFYIGKPVTTTPGEQVFGKSKVKMRQKAGIWSYKTITKEVTRPLTAEERLDERTKLGRDKYCW
ncbi:conserved Plasmodium protein, unknown function [Babesia microti strain RI]|uniref:Uncharacterized protein n=1 Tax=Babesia microti (strain RI) TaxID=1133968 RepID=A0A1R4AAY1_BABMR|nr:conserved Plasmodium protein, unknown function [Babesia microti strain RI]SJK86162.1 conserved Plasmodium protein, unknown function [Babesia microti strain RI]|eukprot:XP_021338355.1 conserved Plasmodium protein, unknown function [Babesia microti strain RI]